MRRDPTFRERELARRRRRGLQQIGSAQHGVEGRAVLRERRQRIARKHVEIDDGRETARMGELEGSERSVERKLRDLRRQSRARAMKAAWSRRMCSGRVSAVAPAAM